MSVSFGYSKTENMNYELFSMMAFSVLVFGIEACVLRFYRKLFDSAKTDKWGKVWNIVLFILVEQAKNVLILKFNIYKFKNAESNQY